MNRRSIGFQAENKVAEYIQARGYVLLSRNYLTKTGEIDIIALDHEVLVFLEVKARTVDTYGAPSEFVTPAKQRRIIRTAELYIIINDLHHLQPRFDVAEVYLSTGGIHYIENAFSEI